MPEMGHHATQVTADDSSGPLRALSAHYKVKTRMDGSGGAWPFSPVATEDSYWDSSV